MGRLAKKALVMLAAMAIGILPMSVSLAAVDCMFHGDSENSLSLEEPNINNHDTLLDDLGDIELVSASDSVSPDNSCSMKLMSAAPMDADIDDINIWAHSFENGDKDYRLTAVLLPTEIRPPIL